MSSRENITYNLEKSMKKVLQTPASFAFFVAIHDFVECIEKNPTLSTGISCRTAINRDLKLPGKYASLRKIHQGIRDSSDKSSDDLGHERYMAVVSLRRIQNNEESNHNSFWGKRETFRKLTVEVYERLAINLSKSKNK